MIHTYILNNKHILTYDKNTFARTVGQCFNFSCRIAGCRMSISRPWAVVKSSWGTPMVPHGSPWFHCHFPHQATRNISGGICHLFVWWAGAFYAIRNCSHLVDDLSRFALDVYPSMIYHKRNAISPTLLNVYHIDNIHTLYIYMHYILSIYVCICMYIYIYVYIYNIHLCPVATFTLSCPTQFHPTTPGIRHSSRCRSFLSCVCSWFCSTFLP